ncbi:alpha/beta hydrolase [Chitinophaga rhizosphaerae]|uniref:alpha/beta hydrolase n=1 Tax=Chitinophaga rhizosphaerae TaxID=1864947 RepID=UPI000F801090|nr:alpha/beta hydrolase family protein [Chitinophaga rhizosphaerae]
MKKIFSWTAAWVLCAVFPAIAAKVDTVNVWSAAMKKNIPAVVITPDKATDAALPVVYLLHGYSGNYSDWVKKVPAVKDYADRFNMIIVCPDGGFGSWYWNSPVDAGFQYETYVAEELVKWVDGKFKTIASPKGRAIMGLSMGGHGALYLAMRHQDVFGAAGSMSGGVDIRPFPKNWDMAKRLGTYAEQPARWEQHTVMNQLHLLTAGSLSLMIDCGTEDFFFGVNEKLHETLLYRNIPHDYVVRPGGHTWAYWANAVEYQLLFAKRFFGR